jgi:excisionase family DNA binding protein
MGTKVCSISGRHAVILDLPTRLEAMDEALTAPKLAKLLGMGRTVVYEMAAAGRIPHFRLGTMIRFDPVQIGQWLRERQIGSTKLAA